MNINNGTFWVKAKQIAQVGEDQLVSFQPLLSDETKGFDLSNGHQLSSILVSQPQVVPGDVVTVEVHPVAIVVLATVSSITFASFTIPKLALTH